MRNKKMWVYYPVDAVTEVPGKAGRYIAYVGYYWLVDSRDEISVYRGNPLCQQDESLCNAMLKCKQNSGRVVKFLPVVYLPGGRNE